MAFAGGSEEKITKARKIIVSAVIGLIVTMASYAIASFVFSRLPGQDGTIPGSCPGVCKLECKQGAEKDNGTEGCTENKKCCITIPK